MRKWIAVLAAVLFLGGVSAGCGVKTHTTPSGKTHTKIHVK